ncbi:MULTISPECIES: glycogen synthase GlgA [Fusobacterium]|uniref:glycogen synthase GlgA n=1 Tax=Fusobacterium TaxID=848 RepID=UPI001477064B|nr:MULTISPECIES: glycogen synthase GlgA [Fusobacterium]NME35088.1 glycogen synthase GlgA [Fusobacterium sp. FSA-380-WT-3A]
MKVLFAASEAAPFLKTGGLADVAYALPKALKKLNIDVRVIIPKYGKIAEEFKEKMEKIAEFKVPVGWRNQYCGLETLEYDGVTFYFLDNEYYFKRPEPYGHYDDGEIFTFFSRAILETLKYLNDFKPDVIHCNDWHTGVLPLFLKTHYSYDIRYQGIKTIYTIHNLKYQGVFSKTVLGELLGLDDSFFRENAIKFYDGISFMKAGIMYSDIVNTVSKSYAEEIRTPYFGENLDGLLNGISYKLYGIVNGIDYDEHNPLTDKNIYKQYDKENLDLKVVNKLELQKDLGLPVKEDVPMIGLVSRLVSQKGLDLIKRVMDEILSLDVQFVVIGTGDKAYEDMFRYYTYKYKNKMVGFIGFDNRLAKRVYAGADLFLMPSQFEPCGIGQLIALRYGTLPIVRETGGLKDTVTPYNQYDGTGNGFSFTNYNAHDMLHVIEGAVELYKDKKVWRKLQVNAMSSDISWKESAEEYKKLYEKLM